MNGDVMTKQLNDFIMICVAFVGEVVTIKVTSQDEKDPALFVQTTTH